MKKVKVVLKILWPFLMIFVGTLIMIWAGVNECSRCDFFEAILYVATGWGWVGIVLSGIGLIVFLYRIACAWFNIRRSIYFVDEDRGSDIYGIGSLKRPYATIEKALKVSKKGDNIRTTKGQFKKGQKGSGRKGLR